MSVILHPTDSTHAFPELRLLLVAIYQASKSEKRSEPQLQKYSIPPSDFSIIYR